MGTQALPRPPWASASFARLSRAFRRIPSARLSRKVALWVFVSVVVIEAIILVPSLHNRKEELLAQVREVTAAKLMVIMQSAAADSSERHLLDRVAMLSHHNHVIGGALYRPDGGRVGVFGDPPALTFDELPEQRPAGRLDKGGTAYDVAWTSRRWHPGYTLIVRHDAAPVNKELVAFTLRIAGLVLIISVFVTIGAMLALYPLVIATILRLRRDLISAGNAIQQDAEAPDFLTARESRQDELGEVIAAFTRTFKQISRAINQRKQAEASLQESFLQVAAYSQALDRELNQGREMQANFLPPFLPQKDGWEFSAFFRPARQVSGDFYDVFELPEGRVGLVIADVCGKGVGAALFMALIRSLIRVFSGQTELEGMGPAVKTSAAEYPPAGCCSSVESGALEAVRLVNTYIIENHGDLSMFATLIFGILDTDSGRLTYVNAGHDPAVILGAGGIRQRLGPSGPAVGVLAEAGYTCRQATLDPGEIFLAFTDGVVDSRSPGDERFGRPRLEQMLDRGFASAAALTQQVQQHLSAYIGDAAPEDDITLLAVQRKSRGPGD
ncbi:MAG: PP2C family protein-serine/threonine phosphatase [Desulfobacterales bacterium]